MVSEYFRHVEKLWSKLAVILFIIQDRCPLILERVKYAIRVVQTIIHLDKVVSKWLHPDQVPKRENPIGKPELQVIFFSTVNHLVALNVGLELCLGDLSLLLSNYAAIQ